MELSPEEIELCARVDFAVKVAQLLKSATGSAVEQAFCCDDELEPQPANALCALTGATYPDLAAINAALPAQYRAYVGTRRARSGAEKTREIVVLRDTDALAFARCRRPDGVNYDISAEQVMAKLEEWNARYGITVNSADHDRIDLNFNSLPDNLTAFAEEIYWFCPTPYMEVGDEENDAKRDPALLERARQMPDVSAQFRERFESGYAEDDWDVPVGNGTGLKMLAASLERDRNLFLWWD